MLAEATYHNTTGKPQGYLFSSSTSRLSQPGQPPTPSTLPKLVLPRSEKNISQLKSSFTYLERFTCNFLTTNYKTTRRQHSLKPVIRRIPGYALKPVRMKIHGFDDKKFKKFTAEKEIRNEYFVDQKLPFNYPKAYNEGRP
jgi:hypothetical protein